MHKSILLLAVASFLAGCGDATSGASASSSDGTSSASFSLTSTTTTATSATLFFKEWYTDGSLRIYYGTSNFAVTDTASTSVSKATVSSRGSSGSVVLTKLSPGTTYYYRFQGYYPNKNVSSYTASGSFLTTSASARDLGTPQQ